MLKTVLPKSTAWQKDSALLHLSREKWEAVEPRQNLMEWKHTLNYSIKMSTWRGRKKQIAHVTRSSLDGSLSDIFNHLKRNKESVPGRQVKTLPGGSGVGELENNSANNFPVTLKMYGGAGSKALRFFSASRKKNKKYFVTTSHTV